MSALLLFIRPQGVWNTIRGKFPYEPGQLIVYSVAVFTPEYKKTFLHDVTKQADSEGKKRCIKQLFIIMSFTCSYIKIILYHLFFSDFPEDFLNDDRNLLCLISQRVRHQSVTFFSTLRY